MPSQDDPPGKGGALEEPLTFVLDDCPFGPGIAEVVKSMRSGELCHAMLSHEYAPGETPRRAIEESKWRVEVRGPGSKKCVLC